MIRIRSSAAVASLSGLVGAAHKIYSLLVCSMVELLKTVCQERATRRRTGILVAVEPKLSKRVGTILAGRTKLVGPRSSQVVSIHKKRFC